MPMFTLMDCLAKAGMTYKTRYRVTKQNRHDAQVRDALKAANIIKVGFSHAIKKENVQNLDHQLLLMFWKTKFFMPRMRSLHMRGEPILETFFAELQKETEWAKDVKATVFLDFAYHLIKARYKWHMNRRPPFFQSQHCKVAKGLDIVLYKDEPLREAMMSEYKIFKLFGGFGQVGSEDQENLDMEEIEGALDDPTDHAAVVDDNKTEEGEGVGEAEAEAEEEEEEKGGDPMELD